MLTCLPHCEDKSMRTTKEKAKTVVKQDFIMKVPDGLSHYLLESALPWLIGIRWIGAIHRNNGLIMKCCHKLLLVFLMPCFIACSSGSECVVADSVLLVREISLNGADHFVYLRISGFHEKETYYELYDSIPEFDVCGKANRQAISEVHIDSMEGVASKLIVKNDKLIVGYSEKQSQRVDFKNMPVQVSNSKGE